MKRRTFIPVFLSAATATLFNLRCSPPGNKAGKYRLIAENDHSATGHQLRSEHLPVPDKSSKEEILIVGGGVSGLSAAMTLSRAGINNYRLLELADKEGGNSVGGSNAISAYPWAAHYLPVPNNQQPELLQFLFRAGVITGFDEKGTPSFNEYHLCFEPEERLFYNGNWRNNLIQDHHLSDKERTAMKQFMALMSEFKALRGNDGLEAFTIPMAACSRDPKITELDNISLSDWLISQHLDQPFLNWYVNYCCLDDYGRSYKQVSAWAGIHYFASRKGGGLNAQSHQMLTWPEGNHFLVKALRKECTGNLQTLAMVQAIESRGTQWRVLVKHVDHVEEILADNVILCAPQYINKRLLKGEIFKSRSALSSAFTYQPWLVANISLRAEALAAHDIGLCWDNVIYGSQSIGYVNACQQSVSTRQQEVVITHYTPFGEKTDKEARRELYEMDPKAIEKYIIEDLEKAHPGISESISEIRYRKWGHGMIAPQPGFLFGKAREMAGQSIGSLHFAHTDLSGISIFEEAFYQGNQAANKVISSSRR